MGDAGEGLVDAEGRAQERMDELAREREERQQPPVERSGGCARVGVASARASRSRAPTRSIRAGARN